MKNDEIFARIAYDVEKVESNISNIRDITIWMTNDLFNQLLPEQFILQKDNSAMITLFGCKVRVVLFPCDGMRWIVGYEGTTEEGE